MPTNFRHEFTMIGLGYYISLVLIRSICRAQFLLNAVEKLRLNAKMKLHLK